MTNTPKELPVTPELDFTNIELSDIIDAPALQELMDDYFTLTGFAFAILDTKGEVLVAGGWQDICVKFHRTHPESCKFCHESDISLSSGVAPRTFKTYRCKNNLWDIATPIMLGDRHIGNIFMGQILFDDEVIDYELFRAQAKRFGYDEAAYIAALDQVPRCSRKTVNTAMSFCSKLAQMISKSNYNNIILADTLAKKTLAEEVLQEKNEEYEALNEELQSSVEELQSATEELQVQNEELQQQEEALRESQHFNKQIIQSAKEGIIVYGPDLRYQAWASDNSASFHNDKGEIV